MLMYMCAKFGACIAKCTILLNIWAKPPHYKAIITSLKQQHQSTEWNRYGQWRYSTNHRHKRV